jgi:hypothetical protein
MSFHKLLTQDSLRRAQVPAPQGSIASMGSVLVPYPPGCTQTNVLGAIVTNGLHTSHLVPVSYVKDGVYVRNFTGSGTSMTTDAAVTFWYLP